MDPVKLRALVADDHAAFRRVLRRLLERQPQIEDVVEAADGPAAVSTVEKFLPDVVCMDVRMPGGGGIEATKQLSPRFLTQE